MKVTKNQRNYPRQVRVYVAATLAFGFFSFMPFDSILAANANGVMSVQQQRQTVTGTVKDANGEPIVGASITIKGSTTGAITNIDGRFSIVAAPGTVLQISYVSYKPQTIAVRDGVTHYNITLEEDRQSLNEVVVVGYGTQKKVNLSGSVAQLDGKTLENRPITNVSSGL